MESELNIFMEKFNKYKNYIFSFFYFSLFLFTLFISLLIIFQQLHKNNINFIYFYLTFCVGLFFLLGVLVIKQDLLSFILFVMYFLYSFFFIFLILRFDKSVYFKNMPIFTAIIIMLSIIFIVILILIGELCYLNESISYFIGINLFSLLFIFYYFYNYFNSSPSIGIDKNYSYVSFYKLYVFIMCTYYFFIYIRTQIKDIQFINILFLVMVIGLLLYVIKINGRPAISLQTFLWIEYIPLFLFGITLFCINIINLFNTTLEGFDKFYYIVQIILYFSIISFFISWFVYLYDTKPKLLSNSQVSIWNFCNIFIILISLLILNKYILLGLVLFGIMFFLLGFVLYFLKFISFGAFNTYYVLLTIFSILSGFLFFIYKNKINPDLVYGHQLLKISYGSVFKAIMAIIILLTIVSFANFSNQIIERFFIMLILSGLPIILFYLFYTSNKKATNTNFLVSCIRMLGEIVSLFFKNMLKVVIFLFIIVLSIICLFNLIVNNYSSIDIYFLAYFFFLILYIVYYFTDFLKGNFSSEKIVRQVSLINLLLFFSGIVIYYLLYGLGYISKGVGSVSKQNLLSQSIFYLILFVFLAFIYVYYRNNISNSTNPYINLIVNFILYIPCLFVNIIEYIQLQMKEKSSPYFIILMIELFLIVLYISTIYLQTKYLTQGGTNLIREPLNLNIDTPLTVPEAYKTEPNKPFAFSFWFYINSQLLTTNKYYNILNYQFRPQILYNPKLNSLIVDISGNNWESSYLNTYNVNSPDNETILDPNLKSSGIIYINNKILLQKWNHLVVNYNGSTMDIFINGKLVKSSSQVVPNIDSLLFNIGQENGINGGICNLMFYNHILTYSTIVTLYDSVKDINPPLSTIYWDSEKKKIQSSQLNKLKEEYKLNKILNI